MIHVAIDSSLGNSLALRTPDFTTSLPNLDFGRDNDRNFLPCLRDFLRQNRLDVQDVEAWTVGTGPGSFAGIRFTLALVKGICTATHAKCRGIPSGYALARAWGREGRVGIVADARCGKAFVTVFEAKNGVFRPVGDPLLVESQTTWPPELTCDAYCSANAGFEEHLPANVREHFSFLPPPDAQWLLQADETIWPWRQDSNIEPLYVRPPA
ncbi:MAG: tRNA (adenosine(37)-N6)-threonylcarbamoyltransferase complex dimerization subunit type 1 TsaB [Victivallales bacterium]|nr:tRNA (adenosine(37)-N6)-threonylcarbamoyltransferase complex dimerization subunit type 1 TsaB [Victivallales bacterium]